MPNRTLGSDTDSPDLHSAAVMEAKMWLQEKKSGLDTNSDVGYASPSLNLVASPQGPQDSGSLVDVAKSYIHSRPPWASPSIDHTKPRTPFGLHLFKEETPYLFGNHSTSSSKVGRERNKMERNALVVCCVAGFLGLLSAATGFVAEATRIKASQVQIVGVNQCVYPRSPTTTLGLIASLALILSQIIINVAIWFVCISESSEISDSNSTVVAPEISGSKFKMVAAVVCRFLSWPTLVFAFVLFSTSALLDDERDEESGHHKCPVVKPGVYKGGAILSLLSVAFGIVSYIIYLTERENGGQYPYPNQGVIAMAQPQILPSVSVSVHEDTYIKGSRTSICA